MKAREVLIVCRDPRLSPILAGVFNRAGFAVDFVSVSRSFRPRRGVRHLAYVDHLPDFVPTVVGALRPTHDLVVLGDDSFLRQIVDSNLDEALKLRLLPVTRPASFRHLFSKTGLAEALAGAKLATPRFRVARRPEEVVPLGDEVGYPLLAKRDASGGGAGVHECADSGQLARLLGRGLTFPLLLQEKIPGTLLDVSGFYHQGQLVSFTHSEVLRTVGGPFGVSSVRRYTQTGTIGEELRTEAAELGSALGISGFTNTSCIQSSRDGRRYYFESDLRPNLWVDHGRFAGEDLAEAIRVYFSGGRHPSAVRQPRPDIPSAVVVPYLHRLGFWEVATNRHNVWLFAPSGNRLEVVSFLLFFPFERAKSVLARWARRNLSLPKWHAVRAAYQRMVGALGRLRRAGG